MSLMKYFKKSEKGSTLDPCNMCESMKNDLHNNIRDDTHMTSMKSVQFSIPPTPLVLSIIFHLLDLGHPISNEPPSPNENQ